MHTKTIVRFVSEPDLTEFADEQKCISHEKLYNSLLVIMNKLPERPDDLNFQNGEVISNMIGILLILLLKNF